MTILPQNVERDQREARERRLSGFAGRDGRVSQPGSHGELPGEGRSPVQRAGICSASGTACTTSSSSNSRGAGGLSAPSASAGLDNIDQTLAVQQHDDAFGANRQRDSARRSRSAICRRRRPIRSARPSASRASRRSARCPSSPTGAVEHDGSGRRQPVAPARRARAAGGRRFPVQQRHHHVSAIRFAAPTRSRRCRTSCPASTTTPGSRRRSRDTVVSQTNPNVGVYVQDEWKVGPQLTLNAGLRYDLQFLETIAPTATTSLRGSASHGRRATSRRTVIRGSAGLFYDRVPLRALANALLSAGNTTDLANLRQISISLSPAQAAAPRFPNILERRGAVGDAVQPDDHGSATCRTRIREQASVEFEQQIGARGTVSVGYQYVRGRGSHHLGEPERADVRGRRAPTTGAARTRPTRTTASIRRSAHSNYHGAAPVVRAAAGVVGQLPRQLHALEVDGRRRRELLQLADRSVRHLEGLGPLRRRPAPSSRRVRLGEFADRSRDLTRGNT